MDTTWASMDPDGLLEDATSPAPLPQVLILTPVKDAARFLPNYFSMVKALSYPHSLISIGLLESDSQDDTFAKASETTSLLNRSFRRARVWKHDFGYRIPVDTPRWEFTIQPQRRSFLARSRNQLLFRALDDEDWVLWLDVDVIQYPGDLVERLLATKREIVQPHCVREYGGATFYLNAWRDRGQLHLEDMRSEGTFAELHAVGGTALWIKADVHRDGLIFPSFPYGKRNPYLRQGRGELETEGLGMMALDMGYKLWGMPHLEVLHHPD